MDEELGNFNHITGKFQSLFWWRGHLDMAFIAFYVLTLVFQSLFWWRGHLDASRAP